MCGRFVNSAEEKELLDRYKIKLDIRQAVPLFEPNYNIAPGALVPVITRNSANNLEIMKWGLIPSWAKDPRIGFKMINARAEGIETKPSFRVPFKKMRCLVPATAFYEWKKSGKDKTPYLIHLMSNEIFSFAGLYDVWKDGEGRETISYTIITTEPNELMREIHDRMPVILNKSDEDAWLDKDYGQDKLLKLLKPYPANKLEAYIVSKEVNTPVNNYQELLSRLN